jgi:hypothetical protein
VNEARAVVRVDTSKSQAALRALVAAAVDFAAQMQKLSRSINVALEPVIAVYRHGPRNVTGDGRWQSDLCGAWVHGSCPAAGRCDCTCHGGSLR